MASHPLHILRCAVRPAVVACVCVAGSTGPVWAQQDLTGGLAVGRWSAAARAGAPTGRGEIDGLRDEVAELRRELLAMRQELRALRDEAGVVTRAVRSQVPAQEAQPVAVPVEVLQTQVEELSQVKVQSGSRFPVTLSGTILSNTVFNSGDANWLEHPNLVGTATGGSMTSTMRQSRIGLDVAAIPVGSWEAKGSLILDFFGGAPGFVTGSVMGLPRLLYAFGRLEKAGTAVQVGQDHVMLAPRDPTSLAAFAFPQFFRAGNLYLRAPQVRVEQRLGAGWTIKTGIVAPVAGDFGSSYVFAPAAGAGERSERPALEGHLGYARGTADTHAEAQVGASGHYGWSRLGGTLVPSSAVALDLNLRTGRVGVAGEVFVADEMDAYGAGVAQRGRAEGGWFEGRFAATSRLAFNGGAALDRRPDGVGPAGRLRNTSAFANAILRFTPEVAASVEYRWLQTRYGIAGNNRENHHVNAVFAVTF